MYTILSAPQPQRPYSSIRPHTVDLRPDGFQYPHKLHKQYFFFFKNPYQLWRQIKRLNTTYLVLTSSPPLADLLRKPSVGSQLPEELRRSCPAEPSRRIFFQNRPGRLNPEFWTKVNRCSYLCRKRRPENQTTSA